MCCCISFRIPRTKQEIEADYIRKHITRKFRKQLDSIPDSEMDEMDLSKGMIHRRRWKYSTFKIKKWVISLKNFESKLTCENIKTHQKNLIFLKILWNQIFWANLNVLQTLTFIYILFSHYLLVFWNLSRIIVFPVPCTNLSRIYSDRYIIFIWKNHP